MTFETGRLLLRPWREDDAEALYKYASDPDVGPAAGWPVHTDVENSREIIRTVLSADGTFAIVSKENGAEPVGNIGYFTTDAKPGTADIELGYWLGKPFWGRGYVPEAMHCLMEYLFCEAGQRRLWAAHFDFNGKSRRVIEKCGFRHEFVRELSSELMHRRYITHYYSIYREEWAVKSRTKE